MPLTEDELACFFEETGARVIHFDTAMTRYKHSYPEKLHHVVTTLGEYPLSCCSVGPGHDMTLPGDVGLIIKISATDLLTVSTRDSGAFLDAEGKNIDGGSQPDLDSIRASMTPRPNENNEWRIHGGKVAGLFVRNPSSINVRRVENVFDPTAEDNINRTVGWAPITL